MSLPKHSSRLNQIEPFFGIVMRKVVRRGNFPSIDDLTDKLRRFIDYFSLTMAHPFHWTYTGMLVQTKPRRDYCPPHRKLRNRSKIKLARAGL